MNWSVIDTLIAFQYEGYLQILLHPAQHLEYEVKYIPAPISRGRNEAVCPAGFSQGPVFLIVKEVVWKFARNFILVTKHKKSGRRRMVLAIFADSYSTDFTQEHLIILIVPKVIDMGGAKVITIAPDGIHAEYGHIHLLKHLCILGHIGGVPEHQRHLIQRAVIVSLMIASEGT